MENYIEKEKILTGWIEGKLSDKEKFESLGLSLGNFSLYDNDPELGMFEHCSIKQNDYSKLKNLSDLYTFDFKTEQSIKSLEKHRNRDLK